MAFSFSLFKGRSCRHRGFFERPTGSIISHMTVLNIVVAIICVSQTPHVSGHARLLNPPSRASAWRVGFNTPIDYNDNEGFCGGYDYQFSYGGGKCGICGDPWHQNPRDHEVGGTYATGTIFRNYQSGQIITVDVEVTSNHKGKFVFKLCPNNDIHNDPTQECFESLKLANGESEYILPSEDTGHYYVKVQLPSNITCDQCIFQWTYTGANNWGYNDDDGSGCVGCGNQEHFRACSDISITSSGAPPSPIGPLPPFPPPEETTTEGPSIATEGPSDSNCHAIGALAGSLHMNKFCTTNCNHVPRYCPEHICECGKPDPEKKTCVAVGASAKIPGMDDWCEQNCNGDPPNCPENMCQCP